MLLIVLGHIFDMYPMVFKTDLYMYVADNPGGHVYETSNVWTGLQGNY